MWKKGTETKGKGNLLRKKKDGRERKNERERQR